MKIAIVGIGYVGLSLGVLLSRNHEVVMIDTNRNKVNSINQGQSPIEEEMIKKELKKSRYKLSATWFSEDAYKHSEFIIVCVPTDWIDGNLKSSIVEEVIKNILGVNKMATIVIKSTVPIGYTENLRKKFKYSDIIFSPEFLREGFAIQDNIHPSRIIVSNESVRYKVFVELLLEIVGDKNVPVLVTSSSEAEAVKLFSNSFLALKIAYFNELDTFAELKNLSTEKIIEGVCYDWRIGNSHNNPSFGFGGYCLPKDSKQLSYHFQGIPATLIKNICRSNYLRKLHIVQEVINRVKEKNIKIVGIYRVNSKLNSDNLRGSSIISIIEELHKYGVTVFVYEPLVEAESFKNCKILTDLLEFKKISQLILANRIDEGLAGSMEKIYTRDVFNKD
ncbi:nucleotide sugar dehydrogenase [Enterococcus faecalis]